MKNWMPKYWIALHEKMDVEIIKKHIKMIDWKSYDGQGDIKWVLSRAENLLPLLLVHARIYFEILIFIQLFQ